MFLKTRELDTIEPLINNGCGGEAFNDSKMKAMAAHSGRSIITGYSYIPLASERV
jgi:hypothetical protein